MVTNLIYFSFIPIGLWMLFYLTVFIMEKYFHYFMPKKVFWLLLTFFIATVIVITLVVLSIKF